jgi:hypothetical protein
MLWSECQGHHPNSYAEIPTPEAIVLRGGMLGGDEIMRAES